MPEGEVVMLKKIVTCFNCGDKVALKKAFTIKLNTLEGAHEVKMCEPCSQQFDEIMKEIEEVRSEGYQSV